MLQPPVQQHVEPGPSVHEHGDGASQLVKTRDEVIQDRQDPLILEHQEQVIKALDEQVPAGQEKLRSVEEVVQDEIGFVISELDTAVVDIELTPLAQIGTRNKPSQQLAPVDHEPNLIGILSLFLFYPMT